VKNVIKIHKFLISMQLGVLTIGRKQYVKDTSKHKIV
jgi:hypothetical protein